MDLKSTYKNRHTSIIDAVANQIRDTYLLLPPSRRNLEICQENMYHVCSASSKNLLRRIKTLVQSIYLVFQNNVIMVHTTSQLIDRIILKCPNFQTLTKETGRARERNGRLNNDSLSLCMDV